MTRVMKSKRSFDLQYNKYSRKYKEAMIVFDQEIVPNYNKVITKYRKATEEYNKAVALWKATGSKEWDEVTDAEYARERLINKILYSRSSSFTADFLELSDNVGITKARKLLNSTIEQSHARVKKAHAELLKTEPIQVKKTRVERDKLEVKMKKIKSKYDKAKSNLETVKTKLDEIKGKRNKEKTKLDKLQKTKDRPANRRCCI